MSAPREIELKLAVDAADVARLKQRLRRFGRPKIEPLETVYHDTADFTLARYRMALRVRRAGARWLQALKTLGASTVLARRGEWELPAPRGKLDVARFAGTPLAVLLRAQPALRIEPQFRTRFTRARWITDDGAIEIALDRGEIVAGDRSAPICELELELKVGNAAALWPLALDLVGTGTSALALVPHGDSKAARGVALALGQSAQAVKANAKAFAPALAQCETAGAALRSVIGTGTTILLANAHGLRAGDDPELIHQARVAVRRMRSAIRLFERDVEFPPRLARELRWLGRTLGAARDWDVFALQTLPSLAPAAQPLHAAAARRRAQALRRVRAQVATARFARLALQLLQWSETTARETVTLNEFAPGAMRRAFKRLIRSARQFERLAPARQHRVRVRAKRLRYAVDALAGTAARSTAALDARLASVQDLLGELNDIAVARRLLAELLAPRTRSLRSALTQRRAQFTRAAAAALAGLARIRHPWA
jgi:triphosphatase